MEQEKNRMGTRPVFPLLITMAVPPMISMLIQSLYNIVDSIFVARLSEEALTAVSLVYPLQNLSLAVCVGLGVGVNAFIARSLGQKNQKQAQEAVAASMILTAVHGLVFVLLGLFLSHPFLAMFTEDAEILKMAVQYSRIVICLTFGSHFHLTVEKIFQATGDMVVPMILQVVGAVINIILDPLFIFGGLGIPAMGVSGAAIATIIGQMAACGLSFLLLQCKKDGLKLRFSRDFRLQGWMVKKIYQVAVPSALMTAMPSALVGILNGILGHISDTGVAVLGLYFKMQSFVYMPASGLVQALRPIVSYNYGAGDHKRLNDSVKAALTVTGVIMAVGTVLFVGFPGIIMKLFDAGPDLMAMGSQALQIISLGFLVSTVSVVYAGTFEAMGKGAASLTISLLRQLTILPVLALILSAVLGVTGVWIAFPVAEAVAAVVAVVLWRRFRPAAL